MSENQKNNRDQQTGHESKEKSTSPNGAQRESGNDSDRNQKQPLGELNKKQLPGENDQNEQRTPNREQPNIGDRSHSKTGQSESDRNRETNKDERGPSREHDTTGKSQTDKSQESKSETDLHRDGKSRDKSKA